MIKKVFEPFRTKRFSLYNLLTQKYLKFQERSVLGMGTTGARLYLTTSPVVTVKLVPDFQLLQHSVISENSMIFKNFRKEFPKEPGVSKCDAIQGMVRIKKVFIDSFPSQRFFVAVGLDA